MADIRVTQWQSISPLLDELLEARPKTRAERLAQISQDDAVLAEQLGALLRQHTAVERDAFLEGSVFSLQQEPTLEGQTIGAYTLREAIGHGGMGSVWRAERTDGLYQATVAVKFLNLALLGRGGAERFAREGNMLARLSHPNIARLLDAGIAAGSQPYLVLEYIDGMPIDIWCDEYSLGIEARLHLFLDVLAAVVHAHSNLILHRDLKPTNILVTPQGQVKLLDFGIGKLIEDQSGAGLPTELTQLAGRAFTLDYAAPEQITQSDVTTATDVYSLGVLLYLLLTGRHPTAQPSAPPMDRLRAVIETAPLRLSDALARGSDDAVQIAHARSTKPDKLARTLRGDLDNIVAKALKKIGNERYSTVSELADDLRRHLRDEPVIARPDSLVYRANKFIRRYRVAVSAAVLTFVALLAGVVGTTWQTVEARRERDKALFETERAVAKGNLVNLMLGAIGDADRPLTQRELLKRSAELIEKQFSADPRIAVDLLLPIAGQFISLGDTDAELAILERAAAIAAPTADPRLIALVACNTVDTEVRKGRVDRARALHQRGIQALAAIGQAEVGITIACLRGEVEMASAQGDLDRALERTNDALSLLERHGRTKGNMYPTFHGYRTTLYRRKGDLQASFDSAKREQQLYEARGDTGTVGYLGTQFAEAAILIAWGEYRAAQVIVEALTQRWNNAGSGGAAPPWLLQAHAAVKLRLDEPVEAEKWLRDVAGRYRAEGGAAHAASAEVVLAQALVELNKFDEASAMIETVETAKPPAPGRYARVTPATVRAQLLLAQGQTTDAARVIESEIERFGEASAQDLVPLSTALRVAAQIQISQGNMDRAAEIAQRAVAVSQRIARNPEASGDLGEALLLLSQAQKALGRGLESAATARRAVISLTNGLGDDHRLNREARSLASS